MKSSLVFLALAALLGLGLSGTTWAQNSPAAGPPVDRVVMKVWFEDLDQLHYLGRRFDVWEVHRGDLYAVVMLSSREYADLAGRGYKMEVDAAKTAELYAPLSIPGYSCYRTVEETHAAMQTLAANFPGIAELRDYGDSWDKVTTGGPGGYDLLALRLTNRSIPGPKPIFFLMAEIHARELATAETALRFAELLLQNYATNADYAFALDYSEIWVVPMQNPDGRKFAEGGEWWRKNTDDVAGGGCAGGDYGVDLNRNSTFHWGGDSNDPCDETYQGPSQSSEPETVAIQTLIRSLFPDQRGPNDGDPAPETATGLYITLHSYGGDVIWPYGHTTSPPPNSAQLSALGTKFASLNGYAAYQSSVGLYITTGATDDFVYGELGTAAFTFEIGTSFFQPCSSFESTVWPKNRDALLYAMKIPKTPYQTVFGPDATNLTATPAAVNQGTPIQLRANVNDAQNGAQTVAGAECYVLALHSAAAPGDPGTGTALQPVDGAWNSVTESAQGTINTGALTEGDYLAVVRGRDSGGNWGPLSAVRFHVNSSGGCVAAANAQIQLNPAVVEPGQLITFTGSASGTEPMAYAWDFGDGATAAGAVVTHAYAGNGNRTVTLNVTNDCGQAAVQRALTVQQVFPPLITAQPAGKTILTGQAAYLEVEVSGTAPFNAQWYRGAKGDVTKPLSGAIGLSTMTPSLTQTSSFWVRVANGKGQIDSEEAEIRVLPNVYDLDGDHEVNALDLQILARSLAGHYNAAYPGNNVGDINRNNRQDAEDLVRLQLAVVGE